jgi:hypothetical protein
MAKEEIEVDFITPLQGYAIQAHELYESFKQAGFTEGEAWELLLRHIPDFELPIGYISITEDELTAEEDE